MQGSEKLDAPSRHLLAMLASGAAEVQDEVGVLVRGHSAFGDRQLDTLRGCGAEVRTVAGDVLTATVQPAALADLAQCDFVAEVQLSQPLRLDEREQTAPYFDVE